jgi:5'(3')-deoxyribonucleotidase
MTQVLEMVLTFLLWYAIGWALFNWVVRPWILRRLETRIAELELALKEVNENVVEAKIEEHHGQFYLFDKNTDHFLAQGYTAQEVADKMKKKLQVYVTAGDPDVIKRFKSTLPADA